MGRPDRQNFHAHETARQMALEGTRLATFPQRAFGLLIDMVVVVLLWAPCVLLWLRFVDHAFQKGQNIHLQFDPREHKDLLFLLVYCVLANAVSNGRSVGKWICRTRVVSLTGERISLWQATERALGYGVALVELVGFFQYFWASNRQCVQDRIAETIVVDMRQRPTSEPSDGRRMAAQ